MEENRKIDIVEKKGWKLNPDEKIVNAIFRGLARTGGHCPCVHPERIGHDQCPCASYLEHDICYCNLYVKLKNEENEKDSEILKEDVNYHC